MKSEKFYCKNCGELILKINFEGKIDSSYIKCHNCNKTNLICASSDSEFQWTEIEKGGE